MKRVTILGAVVGGLLAIRGLTQIWRGDPETRFYGHTRQLISDTYWIRGYDAWLDRDHRRLIDCYSFATALNPNNLVYWRLAAQTIAYDLPQWHSLAGESNGQDRWAEDALAFFERSRSYFEEESDWYVTAGFLAETSLRDRGLALEYLQEAIRLPDFSFQAGRTFARLLVENGDIKEAHQFLVSWFPKLKATESEVHIQEIGDAIISLEKQLTP